MNSWYGDLEKTVSFHRSGVRYEYVAAIAAYVALAEKKDQDIVKQEAQRATYRAPEYNVPPFWRIG